ncbi:MAG TPA: hypothetical protein VEX37_09025 [Thermomicrobiales bacterium]|nr:hypothetical protein [Thermomicrobiales bacterium]
MQPWEYKVLHRVRPIRAGKVGSWDESIVAELPALGDEGWELVTVITRASEPGGISAGVTTDEMWVFKRPKSILSAESTVVVAQAEAEPEAEPQLSEMVRTYQASEPEVAG